MISSLQLNKLIRFTFSILILVFNFTLSNAAVEIWEENEQNSEQNNKIRLMLGMYPADLQEDGAKNSITKNYPQALITYTAALFWLLHMNDAQRGQQTLGLATMLLQSFATQDEVNKLVNITIKLPN